MWNTIKKIGSWVARTTRNAVRWLWSKTDVRRAVIAPLQRLAVKVLPTELAVIATVVLALFVDGSGSPGAAPA